MKDSNISSITYVDADLYFYSDPASLYKDFVKYSILITPHRFPAELRHLEVYGIFNVSFMIFRNDTLGHACLALYRQACINWCYDRLEDNRFADQKYLDSWPNLFTQGLLINDHVGAGLAPWNWFQYKIRNSSKGDGFLVEEAPLVFYHFHGLKFIFPHLVWTGLNDYNSKESSKQLKAIYRVYVQALRQTEVFLKQYQQKIEFSDLRSNRSVLNMLKKSLIRNDVWWI